MPRAIRASLLALGCLLLATGAACGDSGTTSSAGIGGTVAQPTETATPEPVSMQDAELVHAAMDALRTKDTEAIRPFIGLRPIACTDTPTPGGPPACLAGETAGTSVQAFYFAGCEGAYLRETEIDQPLSALVTMDVKEAYRVELKTDAGYQYAIILEDTNAERSGAAWEAIVERGEIIGLLFSCSLSVDGLIDARNYETLVPAPVDGSGDGGA